MLSLLVALAIRVVPSDLDFDTVVKESTEANTPILVDVYTTWSKPCARLERELFPVPEVAAAISKLRFVRYDAEQATGLALAERLGIYSYPSVLVFTPDGEFAGQIHAQSPGPFIEELRALARLASVKGPFTEVVLARPGIDPRVAYLVGLRLRREAPRTPSRAIAAFDLAAARDPDDALGVRSLAVPLAARTRYEAAAGPLEAKGLLELAQLTGSGTAIAALGMLSNFEGAFDPSLARAAGAANREAFVAKRSADGLNQLVYAQLALRDFDGALESARALEAMHPPPGAMDTVAEAYFQANQRERAIELERAALKAAPSAALAANLKRFESEKPVPPPYIGADPLLQEREVDLEPYRETRQFAANLAQACHSQAHGIASTWLRLTIAKGEVSRAVAFDLEAPPPLRRCLERAALGKPVNELARRAAWVVEVQFGESP